MTDVWLSATEEDEDEFPYWMDDDTEKEISEELEKETEPTTKQQAIKYRYVPKNANPWEKDDS